MCVCVCVRACVFVGICVCVSVSHPHLTPPASSALQAAKNQTVVKLTVVSCAPVVEVLIKRPDVKYQLGFSVQNGVVSSFRSSSADCNQPFTCDGNFFLAKRNVQVFTFGYRIFCPIGDIVGKIQMICSV